jgi:hypothetical protein
MPAFSALIALDQINTQIAELLVYSAPMKNWDAINLSAKYTPDGSVGRHDFSYQLSDGATDQGSIPTLAQRSAIYAATERHWRLTQESGQPRWYKMVVTVERVGKLNIGFEYKDDYKEGEISRDV